MFDGEEVNEKEEGKDRNIEEGAGGLADVESQDEAKKNHQVIRQFGQCTLGLDSIRDSAKIIFWVSCSTDANIIFETAVSVASITHSYQY